MAPKENFDVDAPDAANPKDIFDFNAHRGANPRAKGKS
jgi:hypothetical protein